MFCPGIAPGHAQHTLRGNSENALRLTGWMLNMQPSICAAVRMMIDGSGYPLTIYLRRTVRTLVRDRSSGVGGQTTIEEKDYTKMARTTDSCRDMRYLFM